MRYNWLEFWERVSCAKANALECSSLYGRLSNSANSVIWTSFIWTVPLFKWLPKANFLHLLCPDMLKLKISLIVPFFKSSNCISQTHYMPEHFWALICSDNWASNVVLKLMINSSPVQKFPIRWKIYGKWDMASKQDHIRWASFHPCSLMHDYSQSVSSPFIELTHISNSVWRNIVKRLVLMWV